MTSDPAHLEHARQVADAVLYEGYLLYPYRRSAQKNRARFQFGVLMPPPYRAVDDCEQSASQTECLVECAGDAQVEILARFLHLQRRTVQSVAPGTGQVSDVDALWVGGVEYTSWDEAVEREQRLHAPIADLLDAGSDLLFGVSGGEAAEDLTGPAGERAGRLSRRWEALNGAIRVRAERVAGPYGALRLRVRLENRTQPTGPLRCRDDGLRHALIAAHLLIRVAAGRFLSLTDPPEWAAGEASACANIGTWPVLAGPADCAELMLSSPVILYDHPEVAPESAGDLFDATEIDEILTLRTLALTDEEKQQARATDPRAADLIDRLDGLPPEMLERMHGAIRYLSEGPGKPSGTPAAAGGAAGFAAAGPPAGSAPEPWWDPGSDSSVSPETDHVLVAGVKIARGSTVRMRPGSRRADAQDLFLAGREAVVEAVLHDVDGHVHVAVSPVSDPLAELQRHHGRFLYFAPDEIEPVEPAAPASEMQPHTRTDSQLSPEKETT
jgi:hypothetical protein